ncbi:CASP domain-containing protein [Acinetobacter baumannii]
MRTSPPRKSEKPLVVTHVSLRVLTVGLTLAAACLMLTNNQTTVVYGIEVDARCSYASAFTFFAIANLIACGFTVVSLFIVLILGSKAGNPIYYFYIFLHDLSITVFLMSGCGAATAVGYIGEKGNSHIGWTAVCDHFGKFCNRALVSIGLSYVGIFFYLILTVIYAYKSRHVQV